MTGLVAEMFPDADFEAAGLKPVVVTEEPAIFAARERDDVEQVAVVAERGIDPLRDELRNPCAKVFDHHRRLIGGSVIGNDDLDLGRDLRGDALQKFAEKSGAVARRDAEGEEWSGRIHGREVKR